MVARNDFSQDFIDFSEIQRFRTIEKVKSKKCLVLDLVLPRTKFATPLDLVSFRIKTQLQIFDFVGILPNQGFYSLKQFAGAGDLWCGPSFQDKYLGKV